MQSASTATSSAADDVDRPPFGSRFLTAEHDVWSHSAWDSVPPPSDQDEIIAKALDRQRSKPVENKDRYNSTPAKFWDDFYKNNANNFFRDRKWLPREFPELLDLAKADAGERIVLEVGCGAGNTAFPLLAANQNPNLSIYACDYAPTAVEVVQSNPLYSNPPLGRISSSVWDLSSSSQPRPDGIEPGTVDAIVMIFVLSALSPSEWGQAISNVCHMLKPGGIVLLRDYGRHDLTQLRFKEGRLLDENFYIRGDGTRVYFFEIDELARLFTGSDAPPEFVETTTSTATEGNDDDEGPSATAASSNVPPTNEAVAEILSGASTPVPTSIPASTSTSTTAQPTPLPNSPPLTHSTPSGHLQHPLFSVSQLRVDRRLLLNRKRQLKMYRVWMQAKFRKI